MKDPKKKRRILDWDLRSPTNFYPQYGDGRDRIKPIRAIQSSLLQPVTPQYDLSESDTRDEGVGPLVNDLPRTLVPTSLAAPHRHSVSEDVEPNTPKKRRRGKRIRTNEWV